VIQAAHHVDDGMERSVMATCESEEKIYSKRPGLSQSVSGWRVASATLAMSVMLAVPKEA